MSAGLTRDDKDPRKWWLGDDKKVWLENVHTEDKCAPMACVFHNPSNHHMWDWELVYRSDREIFERICPHNVGHPDPDSAAHWHRIGVDIGIHGCDGCCARPPADSVYTTKKLVHTPRPVVTDAEDDPF